MGGIDRVLIDPPREGAQALAQTLAATKKRPSRVVYVSCNPATLALIAPFSSMKAVGMCVRQVL